MKRLQIKKPDWNGIRREVAEEAEAEAKKMAFEEIESELSEDIIPKIKKLENEERDWKEEERLFALRVRQEVFQDVLHDRQVSCSA